MTTCHCCLTDQKFDIRTAQRDLKRFLRRGPDPATRQLLAAIQDAPVSTNSTLLDIGGGVGAIQHALLGHGYAHATQVDASQAYLDISAAEAARRGQSDRANFVHADFRTAAPVTPAADVVTLDRVVCCDPDFASLLGPAADHARRFLALTFPHARWYTRLFVACRNAVRRLLGSPFRAFVHPPAAIQAVLEDHGLRRRWSGGTWIWRAELYERSV